MQRTVCYKQIASSLEHVGLIEPLAVFEQPDGKFLLVDGHKRFAILKSRGIVEVACILATDDEAYTYNRRVSYVPPIAQHLMLLRVLESGVSEGVSQPHLTSTSEPFVKRKTCSRASVRRL
jgi:ParB-like nuclease domain